MYVFLFMIQLFICEGIYFHESRKNLPGVQLVPVPVVRKAAPLIPAAAAIVAVLVRILSGAGAVGADSVQVSGFI